MTTDLSAVGMPCLLLRGVFDRPSAACRACDSPLVRRVCPLVRCGAKRATGPAVRPSWADAGKPTASRGRGGRRGAAEEQALRFAPL
jgi:hypothetical protein